MIIKNFKNSRENIDIKQKDIIIYKDEKWEIISVYDFDDNNIFTVAIAKRVYQ